MEDLCICCGKLPAMSPEQRLLLTKANHIKELPKEVRQSMPLLREELCNACWGAGCDGTMPCKIPPHAWALLQLGQTMLNTGIAQVVDAASRNMESHQSSAKTSGSQADLEAETIGDWNQITDTCWRKQVEDSNAKIVVEIHEAKARAGYSVAIRMVEAAPPGLAGEAITIALPVMSLDEAKAESEVLIQGMFSQGLPVTQTEMIYVESYPDQNIQQDPK